MVKAGAGWLTVFRLVSLHAGDNELELVLPVHPLRRVSGRLVDAGGAALAGELLQLAAAVYRDRTQWLYTNPDGSFLFDLVEEGEYRFEPKETFIEHRIEPAVVEVEGGDVVDLVIQLLPAADITVRGQVVGADPRRALAVTARGPNAQSRTVEAGADGSYRIEHLVPGQWVLSAADGEDSGAEARVTLGPDSTEVVQDLVFSLHEVSGRVVDRNRNPVPGAFVDLSPGWNGATTSADGSFSLRSPEGSYKVRIFRNEQKLSLAAPLEVRGEPVIGVELVFAIATLHGNVLGLEPGDELRSAYIEGGIKSAKIDPEGDFTFDEVAPGRWSVEADLAGGEKASGEVTVPVEATDVAVELTLERGSLELSGQITGDQNPALYSVEIQRQDGRYGARSPIDSRGAFRFMRLAPGDYVVIVTAYTPEGETVAGRQEVALAGNDEVAVAVDPAVHAIRPAPAALPD